MKSFLGVPILLRGVAFGNLYLTEKIGGADFTDEDEELTQLLAAQAAVAIENTRLYETSTRWLRHFETMNEIGDALAGELELEPLLGLVARRLRSLIQARLVLIALPDGGGTGLSITVADGEGSDAYGLVGTPLELGGSKTGRVIQRGRSERVDSVLDDPEIDQQTARRMGVTSALYVPLVVRGRPIGVVVAHDKLGATSSFTDDEVRLTESLATRAATAVDLSERVSRDVVRRVVDAQEVERARLARELHDETGQALTSILLGLKSLEERVESADGGVAFAELRDLVVATLQDVRRLAVELRPAALDDFGLVPALERLRDSISEQRQIAVEVQSDLDGRALARGDRDRPVPNRAGGADQRRQARRGESGDRVAKEAEREVRGTDDSGRWSRIRPERGARRRPRPGRHAGTGRAPGRSDVGRIEQRGGDDAEGGGTAGVIRVLIVDDHAVVRSGLRRLLDLESDMETVGEAPNVDRAVFEAIEGKPDVVLMDLVMPEKGGIEGMPAVLQAVPEAKVLVLSMQDDPRYVRAAFEAGASGYVLKEAADTEVVAAIRAVAAGERYVHPALGARLVAADAADRRRAEQDPLSEREREVLRLLALGHTNQEIAKELYISVRTAETHRAHIMQKLSLSSRAELVRYALAEGLLEPG